MSLRKRIEHRVELHIWELNCVKDNVPFISLPPVDVADAVPPLASTVHQEARVSLIIFPLFSKQKSIDILENNNFQTLLLSQCREVENERGTSVVEVVSFFVYISRRTR